MCCLLFHFNRWCLCLFRVFYYFFFAVSQWLWFLVGFLWHIWCGCLLEPLPLSFSFQLSTEPKISIKPNMSVWAVIIVAMCVCEFFLHLFFSFSIEITQQSTKSYSRSNYTDHFPVVYLPIYFFIKFRPIEHTFFSASLSISLHLRLTYHLLCITSHISLSWTVYFVVVVELFFPLLVTSFNNRFEIFAFLNQRWCCFLSDLIFLCSARDCVTLHTQTGLCCTSTQKYTHHVIM